MRFVTASASGVQLAVLLSMNRLGPLDIGHQTSVDPSASLSAKDKASVVPVIGKRKAPISDMS